MGLNLNQDYLNFGFAFVQFILSGGLLLWILGQVFKIKSEVGKINESFNEKLGAHTKKIDEVLQKEKTESISAHRRVDIHDAIASQVTEKPFRSKPLVDRGEVPKIHKNIQRLVTGGSSSDD